MSDKFIISFVIIHYILYNIFFGNNDDTAHILDRKNSFANRISAPEP